MRKLEKEFMKYDSPAWHSKRPSFYNRTLPVLPNWACNTKWENGKDEEMIGFRVIFFSNQHLSHINFIDKDALHALVLEVIWYIVWWKDGFVRMFV